MIYYIARTIERYMRSFDVILVLKFDLYNKGGNPRCYSITKAKKKP